MGGLHSRISASDSDTLLLFLGLDFDFCQAKKTWSWFTDEEGLKAFGCAAKLHLLYLWYIFPAPWDRIVGVAWAIMP